MATATIWSLVALPSRGIGLLFLWQLSASLLDDRQVTGTTLDALLAGRQVRSDEMATATMPRPPENGLSPRRLGLIMVSLVLALVPLQLDALVAATALPTIAGDLGGFDDLAWITTSYLLAMAIGTIVAGRLGDMFGRRRLL